jgi:general secretion pathway protein D
MIRTPSPLASALALPVVAVPVLSMPLDQHTARSLPVPAFGLDAGAKLRMAEPAIPQTPAIALPSGSQVSTTIVEGEAPAPVAARPAAKPPAHGSITLNLPSADVTVVARAVLGDLLHRNYTIAQSVTGTVTFVTPYPVARQSLLPMLEDALRASNLALVPVAGGFEIQPVASASGVVGSDVAGFGSEVITLRFINTEEVRKVLDNLLPGVVTATNQTSGTITIAGTTGQRTSARDLLKQFDVDWLRNTSFALYVPHRTDARLIVPSLDKLINAADSPTHGLVRLIAMDQVNGILAISMQPQYLNDVQRWVEILDREGESAEPRIFVYRVQNGRARDLTRTINMAFGGGGGGNGGPEAPYNASGDASGQQAGGFAPPPAPEPRGGSTNGSYPRGGGASAAGASPPGQGTRVTADEVNNAVLVYAVPRQYAVIEDALRKLDLPPTQVLIEAAITEVGLTDDLGFGVQWNFNSNGSSLGVGTASSAPGTATTFSYAYTGSSISASLKALETRTSVKVVSAPKLLVLNNQTAALQVGDQVPISTGTATNLTNTNSVVSTIEYRDTGVILKITPRVNASGVIQLDVSQEVSDISTAAASAQTQQQSPTISTRRIATTVAVADNQVIALGGLFRDNTQNNRNGIPLISRIPVLGGLFGNQQKIQRRTELIVLLKPHVLRDPEEGRAATEELRSKLRMVRPFGSGNTIP